MGAIVSRKPTSNDAADALPAELVADCVALLQSDKSKKTATQSLDRAARALGYVDARAVPWNTLVLEDLGAMRSQLAQRHAPATANLTLSMVRSIYRIAFVRGLIDARAYEAVKLIRSVRGTRIEKGRSLTQDEERALQKYVLQELGGAKYRATMLSAAITTSIGAGLRREEVCRLALGAYTPDGLHVLGKGNKERLMPIDNDMRLALDGWLFVRARLHVDHLGLFCSPQRPDRPMSEWSWWHEVRRAADVAGVRLSGPHDFRRTFATRLLDAGYDLRQVQALMGHESVDTTAKYDKREMEALKKKRLETKIVATMKDTRLQDAWEEWKKQLPK